MRDEIAAARRNPNSARTIAVDAMGGDLGPEVVVRGAVDALNRLGTPIILVGDQESIQRELSKLRYDAGKIEIQHCTQVAGMGESPSDVLRRKKDSSIYVAFELVRQGRAAGAISAGNSGATMAVGSIVLGRVAGVERPAIAGIFPTRKGPTVVIDIGANVDCKPSFLYQFGVMGEAYAQEVLKIGRPRIGVLSIGEEEGKGNELVRRTHDLLKASDLNFIGNVEGRDVFSGDVDVVVCDGFVGNVVLKLAEGVAETIGFMLKESLTMDWISKLGALFARRAFGRFKQRMDYSEYGGAPLLGLNGVGIISHGRSSAKAIMNAIGAANEMIMGDVPARLEARLKERPENGHLKPAASQ